MAVLVRRHVRIVIGKIRRKLGDGHAQPCYLQTEPGSGLSVPR